VASSWLHALVGERCSMPLPVPVLCPSPCHLLSRVACVWWQAYESDIEVSLVLTLMPGGDLCARPMHTCTPPRAHRPMHAHTHTVATSMRRSIHRVTRRALCKVVVLCIARGALCVPADGGGLCALLVAQRSCCSRATRRRRRRRTASSRRCPRAWSSSTPRRWLVACSPSTTRATCTALRRDRSPSCPSLRLRCPSPPSNAAHLRR
jgi:hypothetical protein